MLLNKVNEFLSFPFLINDEGTPSVEGMLDVLY